MSLTSDLWHNIRERTHHVIDFWPLTWYQVMNPPCHWLLTSDMISGKEPTMALTSDLLTWYLGMNPPCHWLLTSDMISGNEPTMSLTTDLWHDIREWTHHVIEMTFHLCYDIREWTHHIIEMTSDLWNDITEWTHPVIDFWHLTWHHRMNPPCHWLLTFDIISQNEPTMS